jgi:hypothetical protein
MAEKVMVVETDEVAFNRALRKYEERAAELPAKDSRFANALAEEHGVTELRADAAHDAAVDELDALEKSLETQPEALRLGLYIAGIGVLLGKSADEGPAIVRHLAAVLEARGFDKFKAARTAALKEKA